MSPGSLDQWEARLAELGKDQIHLTLFVSGASPNSARAVANARAFCEGHLAGRYDLEVIDVHQRPAAAVSMGILAVPALVRGDSADRHMAVGDLSDPARVSSALDLLG
jgi:circadian clock protein KaiB